MINLNIVTLQHSLNCPNCGNKKIHIRKTNKFFNNFKELEKYRKGIKDKGFLNVYFCYKLID